MWMLPRVILDAAGQTSGVPSASPQTLGSQNLQGGSQVASPVTTGQTTSTVTPATNQISPSTTTTSFSSVGRGMPGMPGGPRMGSPGGALDPSSNYMTPPIVGPLFCDPALNLPC